ncbi:hypothetical protein [Moorena sp. SIO3H5]|uniref:hypothetical protein n=1 Tax=Moorena sp. SIO3H5 TaxID=2607834 RepID=UPI0013BD9145|nr:hypothetical protein [Moorena sp. SIO3H5]NEO68347.1 hypothetical protein [Moorena sp. SIO3H5]
MKCIQCNTDNNFKERIANQGRCKRCNHPFAFEPKTMGKFKVTDSFFNQVIKDISANNTLFFTYKQFLYFLEQRFKRKRFVNSNLFSGLVYLFLTILGLVWLHYSGLLIQSESLPLILGLAIWNFIWIYILFKISNSPQLSLQVRRKGATELQIVGVFILIVGLFISFSSSSRLGYLVTATVGLSALWLGLVQKRRIAKISETFLISATQMEEWLNLWRRANGEVNLMLDAPTTGVQSYQSSSNQTPDLTAYSFDRLVVCDKDEIARMLIANNVHFENNCAVLGISGYPQPIFNITMEMLRRNPDLQVFALHDCSPEGIKIVHELRNNQGWFAGSNVVIVDVGLLPRQIMASAKTIKTMFVQKSDSSAQTAKNLTPQIRQNLSRQELEWLDAGYFVELESFPPQKLIRILQQSMAKSQAVAFGNEGADETSNSLSFEISFYVDSFG